MKDHKFLYHVYNRNIYWFANVIMEPNESKCMHSIGWPLSFGCCRIMILFLTILLDLMHLDSWFHGYKMVSHVVSFKTKLCSYIKNISTVYIVAIQNATFFIRKSKSKKQKRNNRIIFLSSWFCLNSFSKNSRIARIIVNLK